MFITKRKANRLELEYEALRSLVLSIYKKISYNDSNYFNDFEVMTVYTIMQMQHTDDLEDVAKNLIKRIILYNDSIARANSRIKIGNVKLPPVIII
jgi:hypothetical protein